MSFTALRPRKISETLNRWSVSNVIVKFILGFKAEGSKGKEMAFRFQNSFLLCCSPQPESQE